MCHPRLVDCLVICHFLFYQIETESDLEIPRDLVRAENLKFTDDLGHTTYTGPVKRSRDKKHPNTTVAAKGLASADVV